MSVISSLHAAADRFGNAHVLGVDNKLHIRLIGFVCLIFPIMVIHMMIIIIITIN